MMLKRFFMLTACLALLASMPALAQETPPAADPNAPAAAPATPAAAPADPAAPAVRAAPVPFTDSFFFSPVEIATIQRALAGTVAGTAVLQAATPQQIPPVRRIRLSGVVYKSDADWIVWLNGHKVTQAKLLPEIMEIKVAKEQVFLKWFDIGLNKIISITLRPHQTYDIVTGVLLPG